jgi:hypothetical protein
VTTGSGNSCVDRRQTSTGGIYAAGDLANPLHGALMAAASGAETAYFVNHELTVAASRFPTQSASLPPGDLRYEDRSPE